MKEFDKWWSGNSPAIINTDVSAAVRVGWKAALEWVTHMVIHESDGPSNPKDLMERISEELLSNQTNNSTD